MSLPRAYPEVHSILWWHGVTNSNLQWNLRNTILLL